MRLFIGIQLHNHPLLVLLQKELKQGLSQCCVYWEQAEKIHLTLQFLGNLENNLADSVQMTLAEVAKQNAAFQMAVKGLGFFGAKERPRVIWAGIESNFNLQQLQQTVVKRMGQFGFTPKKAYRPHVTLGRIKSLPDHAGFQAVIQENHDKKIDLGEVKSFQLFKSELSEGGARHEILGDFQLQE